VSAPTRKQALNAIAFLYREVLDGELAEVTNLFRAQKRLRLSGVFIPKEVDSVLARLEGVQRLQASLMYGSEPRLMDCIRLRVKDRDFGRLEICVRDGKRRRDRVTMRFATASRRISSRAATTSVRSGNSSAIAM
jgi:hypothetical protein